MRALARERNDERLEAESKSIAYEAADWLWGTVQGGFHEEATTSQIIVDALIGMVPLVGDVTAVRDLIAVVLGMVDDPRKREDKREWLLLVILLFALLPVVGGAIKGVGRLLLKATTRAAEASQLIAEIIKVLNRMGHGDALVWFKNLDLQRYIPDLKRACELFCQRLEDVIARMVRRLAWMLPDRMVVRLQSIGHFVGWMRGQIAARIPEAVKELNDKLVAVQRQVYEGEWHHIPTTWRSQTRELEARIVELPEGQRAWKAEGMHHPQNDIDVYVHDERLPDLSTKNYVVGKKVYYEFIAGFCGPITPKFLPGGTKIYRVLDRKNPVPDGRWWLPRLPASGREWREKWAVLDEFSSNKIYVEIEIPEGGLLVWSGKVASQLQNDLTKAAPGQYLPGGETQYFIDMRFVPPGSSPEMNPYNAVARRARAAERKLTSWSDVQGINVPPASVNVQDLTSHERALKRVKAVSTSGARVVQSPQSQEQFDD